MRRADAPDLAEVKEKEAAADAAAAAKRKERSEAAAKRRLEKKDANDDRIDREGAKVCAWQTVATVAIAAAGVSSFWCVRRALCGVWCDLQRLILPISLSLAYIARSLSAVRNAGLKSTPSSRRIRARGTSHFHSPVRGLGLSAQYFDRSPSYFVRVWRSASEPAGSSARMKSSGFELLHIFLEG